jgi:hypothetical protein
MAKGSVDGGEVSALLQGARGDVPTEAEQQALLASLEAAIATGGGGGGAPPPVAPTPAHVRGGRAWKAGAGLVVVGGACALWLALRGPSRAPSAMEHIIPSPPVAASATPVPGGALDVPTAASPAGPAAPPQDATARNPSRPARVDRGVASEAALIEAARSVVRRDPARALAITETHRRSFPSGELAPEREVLAIDALVRLGRRDEARARADAFRTAHPRSIHTARIAAILGDDENRQPR